MRYGQVVVGPAGSGKVSTLYINTVYMLAIVHLL